MPINTSIIATLKKGGIQDVKFKIISRDKSYTAPTLEFKFDFKLPEPRKMRIIARRDRLGRIIKSIPPEMCFEATSKPSYRFLQQ